MFAFLRKVFAAGVMAALVAAMPAGLSGQESDTAADAAAKSDPAPNEAATTPPARPLMSFDAGELALLRKLALRRQELDDREARLAERERLAEAFEAKLMAQTKELKRLQAALAEQEEKMAAVEAARQSVDSERVRTLAAAYKAMKPRDAARLFDKLDLDLATAIAREISPRVLAPVMAKMDPKRARELTEALRAG